MSDSEKLNNRLARQELLLQAAFGEMAELRKLLEGTLTGVANLSDLKAEDIDALQRIEKHLDRLEDQQGNTQALVQEINRRLSEGGL